MSEFNIVLAGVGGQGLVLLSNIIGSGCSKAQMRAITGELHGLSQRSGTISIHLRIGEEVHSPLIPYGAGDLIIGLEAMEALRYIEYLKGDGVILMNTRVINPPVETATLSKKKETGFIKLEDIIEKLKEVTDNIALIDALRLAKEAGSPLTENVVFLGALSAIKAFPLEVRILKESVAEVVPKKALDVNLKAFDLGYKSAYESLCNSIECVERE